MKCQITMLDSRKKWLWWESASLKQHWLRPTLLGCSSKLSDLVIIGLSVMLAKRSSIGQFHFKNSFHQTLLGTTLCFSIYGIHINWSNIFNSFGYYIQCIFRRLKRKNMIKVVSILSFITCRFSCQQNALWVHLPARCAWDKTAKALRTCPLILPTK